MAKNISRSVYDMCQYTKCNNGKRTNHRLFRFPKTEKLRKLWVENSGNRLLRIWAKSSLLSAGLCDQHFQEEDFTDETKTRLKRNKIPISWKGQDVQIKQEQTEAQHLEAKQQRLQQLSFLFNLQKQQEEKPQKVEQQQEEEHQQEEQRCVFIKVQEQHYEEEATCMDSKIDEDTRECFSSNDTDTLLDSSFNTSIEEDSNFSYLNNNIDFSTELQTYIASREETTSRSEIKVSRCCKLYARSKQTLVDSLTLKVKQLQKALKAEKMRNFRLRKSFTKFNKKNTSIDDFLANEEISKTAKTMIKLQLHKKMSPYAKDEKKLAKQMYDHSAASYIRLKKSGLNLPSESTVHDWASEYDVLEKNDSISERMKNNSQCTGES